MGFSSRRFARVSVFLALLAVGLAPGLAHAQTTVVTNPTTLVFTPSADQNATLSTGGAAVDHYNFDVYAVGAAQPFQSTNIGKPAPASDGLIHYDFSSSVAGWPLPGGNYVARVAAVGAGGTGTSAASNTFTFSSCSYALASTSASVPAAGGTTQVSLSAGSGCTWTAASAVSWVSASPASGTGSATVTLTVAANTATTSRTGTATIGTRLFTINQAAASTSSTSAPSAPSAPSPAAGATSVSTTPTLSWTASGATSYAVRFGTANPPAQVASGLAAPSYAPGTLTAGTTYYWQIVATNAVGSTSGAVWSFTTAASTTPTSPTPGALPTPWANRDIGTVGVAGSASYSSGVFTVKGAGADIWGTADSFQYVYQPLSGNGQIVARVTSLQSTNSYAKAGVMLRQSLTSGSADVILNVNPGGGVEFMTRSASGGSTTYLAGTTQPTPAWLKLVRSGSTVTASVSADGSTWRTVGSTSVSLTTSTYIGLAVTSHNTTVANTATFDNVAVQTATVAGLPAPWTNRDIGNVGVAGSATYASGKFTVKGAGADIWGTTDGFQYVYQPLPADGQIVVRVTGIQNTNYYAKAGVMLRSALTAGASHVMLDVNPNANIEFMTRTSSGGSTTYLGGTNLGAPVWLRLVRTGSTVTASASTDGTTWKAIGSTTVSFTGGYVGLAVASLNTTTTNTSTFDNVAVR